MNEYTSPDLINSIFSYAKVEKVVSPPQNPVAINIICGEFI